MRLLVALTVSLLLAPGLRAQDWAVSELRDSPRHHEWVEVPAGDRTVSVWVAYPERAEPALPVLIIHENRGLTDWVRLFADELAEAGFLALAPDLLSDFDAEHARTSDFADSDDARTALYQLSPDQVTQDLSAALAYAGALPASEGTPAVVGFCWGGAQAFRLATNVPELSGAFVFYGSPPADDALAAIEAPVYGFYGEDDARINATIEATGAAMATLGKTYEPVIYPGVGHAFMRRAAAPGAEPVQVQASQDAFDRLVTLLGGTD